MQHPSSGLSWKRTPIALIVLPPPGLQSLGFPWSGVTGSAGQGWEYTALGNQTPETHSHIKWGAGTCWSSSPQDTSVNRTLIRAQGTDHGQQKGWAVGRKGIPGPQASAWMSSSLLSEMVSTVLSVTRKLLRSNWKLYLEIKTQYLYLGESS